MAQVVKNPPAMWETWIQSLGWEDPLEEAVNPLQYSCLANPHGQRSLVRYRPWGCKELDMIERLNTAQHTLCLSVWAGGESTFGQVSAFAPAVAGI